MRTLMVVAVVFTIVGTLALAGAATNLFMGSEAADNVCDDPGLDTCAGRDTRAENYMQSGQAMLWGGVGVLALATLLFVVNALWVAPRATTRTARVSQDASNP